MNIKTFLIANSLKTGPSLQPGSVDSDLKESFLSHLDFFSEMRQHHPHFWYTSYHFFSSEDNFSKY